MTKRDFEFIARVIQSLRTEESREGVAWAFAKALTATNPRFDQTRFVQACQPGQGHET